MDHIPVVNQVIEKSAEYTKSLFMAFMAYAKAFHFPLTAAVLEAIKDRIEEETYIRLLGEIYKEFTGRITLHKQSDKFPIRKGVRQGDIISPELFTACQEAY